MIHLSVAQTAGCAQDHFPDLSVLCLLRFLILLCIAQLFGLLLFPDGDIMTVVWRPVIRRIIGNANR